MVRGVRPRRRGVTPNPIGVPYHHMGYTFVCDGCGEGFDHFPPFAGEFTESFLKSTKAGGIFAEAGWKPGMKVTVCAGCMKGLVL